MSGAPRCDHTRAWVALQGHYEAHGRELDLREAFTRDPRRFETLSFAAPEVFVDLSKQRFDLAGLRFALDLARECGLEARRDAMLAGAIANPTEGRAVLHTALRAPRGAAPFSEEVHGVLDAMLAFAEEVRTRAAAGELTDIVNIGIGGSDLGPAMAVRALEGHRHPKLRLHFVSNVDGHDIAPLLGGSGTPDAKKTLFVIASKTFTTQETMANAAVARAWFKTQAPAAGSRGALRRRDEPRGGRPRSASRARSASGTGWAGFIRCGVRSGCRSPSPSAGGLPRLPRRRACARRALRARAARTQRRCCWAWPTCGTATSTAPRAAAWRSITRGRRGCRRTCSSWRWKATARASISLASRCPSPPARSSGASFCTNGQHAFFQMLHQGTDVVPVEFIAVRESAHGYADSHAKLLANCLAHRRR
ncbi:MAG: glucose-6-phosphate isomerase [Rubrivivax sp.]